MHRRATGPISRRHNLPAIRQHDNRLRPRRHSIPPPHKLVERNRPTLARLLLLLCNAKRRAPGFVDRNKLALERRSRNRHYILRLGTCRDIAKKIKATEHTENTQSISQS
jgi:hypothetical protein